MKTKKIKTEKRIGKLKLVLLLFILLVSGVNAMFAQNPCNANFSYSTNPSSPGAVIFTYAANSGTINGFIYSWNFGDGTYATANSSTSFTHNYNTNGGGYVVCLTVNDSLNGCNATFCDSVIIGNSTGTNCTAYFTASDSAGYVYFNNQSVYTNATCSWDFGDGTSATGNGNMIHQYTGNGTYTACLYIIDNNGIISCSYCDTIVVGNNTSGSCNANFIMYPDTLNGSTNTYTATNYSTGNSLNYFWDFGDGTTSTLINPTHTYNANGAYTVCLTVTSSVDSTCSNTYCDYITIGNNTGPCTANYTIYPDSASTGTNTYSAYNYSTGNSLTYFWNFGDGTTSNLENPVHTFTSNGTYTICLTVSSSVDSSCYNTSCQTLSIGGNPAGGCNASFQVMPDSTNTSNFFLYLSSNNSNLLYSWDFGDGTSSTQQYPTHTYAGSGPYVVCLTVSDGNGCTDTYCDSVYAGRASGVLTITVVNPTATSVNDNAALINSLVNYPNPFSNTTTIDYSINQDASVELCVLDLLGNKIAVIESGKKSSGSYQTEWNASNISAGIYMLQLKVNNQVSIKKLMITK